MKVMIAVPSFGTPAPEFWEALLGMVTYTARCRPEIIVNYARETRTFRDFARNTLAQGAIDHGQDAILFLDDDMVVEPDTLARLVDADRPVVGALCAVRHGDHHASAYRSNGDGRYHPIKRLPPNGLVSVDMTGAACLLVRTSVLRTLGDTWFRREGSDGEDVYFCKRLQGAGIPVVVDCAARIGHLAPQMAALYPSASPDSYKKVGLTRQVGAGASARPVYIIMPVSDQVELTRQAVAAIRANTLGNTYEMVYVISERDQEKYAQFAFGGKIITHTLKPFNFAAAVNLGLRACPKDADVVVINNDTEVAEGWLDALRTDSQGMALTMARSEPGCIGNTDAVGPGPCVETRAPGGCIFFCVYIPWRVREVVGELDEGFEGYGGEDTDYTLRCLRHGFGARVSRAFVFHKQPSASYKAAGFADGGLDDARVHWRAKWGSLAPDFYIDGHVDPLISVIMPAHNHARYLTAAVNSVLGQSYPSLEVIVIDDGSTDRTGQVVAALRKRDRRVRYARNDKNRGVNWAKNHGHSLARGEFIAWMDADDIMWPKRLEVQLARFRDDPDLDVVYGGFRYVWSGRVADVPGKPFNRQLFLESRADGHTMSVCGGTLMMRAGTFRRFGGLKHGMDLVTEYDWIARTTRKGLRLGHVPEILIDYMRHEAEGGQLTMDSRCSVLHAAVAERELAIAGGRDEAV